LLHGGVCVLIILCVSQLLTLSQAHLKIYPTLSRIALDVLAAQASLVPCEHPFSAGKEIADERHACLGTDRFEQLQMLKFEWKELETDYVAWNSDQVEEVMLDEYAELLKAELAHEEWDTGSDCDVHVVK
jgi:hypothetical protein